MPWYHKWYRATGSTASERGVRRFNSLYFLRVAPGTNPEFDRPEGIFQNHVELIQAVALRRPIDETETARIGQAGDDRDRAGRMALSSLRLYAAVVRGLTYHSALKPALLELFAPLDYALSESLGVSAGSLVDWWWGVTEEVEERLAAHLETVRTVSELPLDDRWPDRVREIFPRLPAELDDGLSGMSIPTP